MRTSNTSKSQNSKSKAPRSVGDYTSPTRCCSSRNVDNRTPSEDEIEMKNNRTPSEDEVEIEAIKLVGTALHQAVCRLFNTDPINDTTPAR